jgi:chromate transporter
MPPPTVPFRDAVRVWLRVAALSFGGPAGQIAVMHRIVVEEKRWLDEHHFLHALSYCMLLPGPEAQQLATYVGWLLHGSRGGLVAGTLFVLPGFLSILALSILYAGLRGSPAMDGLLFGLKPAVMAVVVEAVLRIGRRALRTRALVGLAATAFVAMFFLDVPFPLVVLGAGAFGLAGSRLWPGAFPPVTPPDAGDAEEQAPSGLRSLGRTLRVAALWLALWWLPVGALALACGREHVLVQEALFFSKTAVVTFGGAYAVLAYIAQQAVGTFHWLAPGEMLDGLGMAETTPGPLIQVVQFVGFMGAYRHPGSLGPMTAGVAASLVTTWVTFAPCFLWIFVGAPFIERLRGNRPLAGALAAITAAVVGVILNLALWFALHTLFGEVAEVHAGAARLLIPRWGTLDLLSLGLAAGAGVALLRFRAGVAPTIAGTALLGAFLFALR